MLLHLRPRRVDDPEGKMAWWVGVLIVLGGGLLGFSYDLIHNQFVKLRGLEGWLWQSLRGSGMGLLHSGDIADTAFQSKSRTSLVFHCKAAEIQNFPVRRHPCRVASPTTMRP